MPTVAISHSMRSHSWSLVNFSMLAPLVPGACTWAVQREARSPRRGRACREHPRTQECLRRGNTDLKAVLPGVAGAGDHAIDPRDRDPRHVHETQGCNRGTKIAEDRLRERPLQRDERARVQTLDNPALGQGCTQVRLVVL